MYRQVEKVDFENLSRELFMKMIHQPKPQHELELNNIPIDEQIDKLMETNDIQTLKDMFDYIIQTPHIGLISPYILKIISLLSQDFDLVTILDSLTQHLNHIDSINPIIDIYLKYIELSKNGMPHEQTKELAKLFSNWIEKLPDLYPLDDLFSTIMDNTLSYFSDEYPSFIHSLIAKNENINLTKKLLLELLKQTVPTRYSFWLISNLFETFHGDEQFIKNIIDILISQLEQTEDIQSRALSIIYHAFQYEADFYRLNDSKFGYTQKVSILYNETEFNFECSFHTFNTTRRLYAAISQRLNISINSFYMKMNEDMNDNIIQFNMPLQILNMKPLQTLKLAIFDINEENLSNESEMIKNESELIKNSEYIKPLFLQHFQDHVDLLWDFLENSKFSEFVFEMLLLYEQFHGDKRKSTFNRNLFSYFKFQTQDYPLQSILLGNCDDPFEFKTMRPVFPTAIKVYTSNELQQNSETNEAIVDTIQFLIDAKFDQVSMAIICSSILKLNMKFTIPKNVLQKGLIECKLQILRDLIMNIVSITESDIETFMSLIDVALIKNNRNHVKEFFECIKKLNMPADTFIPYYKVLEQLEYSHYKDPDEAFICLLELIPVNEETVNLTIDRLFAPPTCRKIAQPFVHTIESWTAALKFLMTPISINRLNILLSNLQIPCVSGSSLSCDFTYKGRNGIYNLGTTCYLNALLQVFNAIQPLSIGLISYDTSELTHFEIELRNILAQLRYVRETVISTASFVETIPNFQNGQQDAIEFMGETFIRQMNHDITDIFHGQTMESICSCSDDQILSENSEDFYILSLPTFANSEGFSMLDQAFKQFFIDEPIVDGYTIEGSTNEHIEAYHHKSIIKWPYCLALQLQRYEFSKTIGGSKLVHCFGFPIEIDPNELNCSKGTVKCDFKYNLVGVVIHQGTADQGHYYAVVEGDDKEWYLCNDKSIVYFDIKELPDFAFGMSEASLDEDISTAYLLFYCRQDMPQMQVKIPSDLEEKLNTMNMNSWPQTIFRNGNFLTYVHELLELELKSKQKAKSFNKDLLYLGFHAFIKIAMCNEEMFDDWNKFLQKLLLSPKNENQIINAVSFFDYINDHVGKSLLQIFNRSASIINILNDFISTAILIPSNNLDLLEIIIQNIDLKCGKKQVLNFAYELIELVCGKSKIDWSENIQQLQSIYQYFLIPITKDLYKNVGNAHSSALNSLLGIYLRLYSRSDEKEINGLSKAISNIFNMNNLNLIATSLKKCSNFDKLIEMYHQRRPDVFFNYQEATPQAKSILKIFSRSKLINMEDENYFDMMINQPFNFPTSFSDLMFSNIDRLRKSYSEKLCLYIEANQAVKNFLNQRIIIHHFSQSNCERIYNLHLSSSVQKNSENAVESTDNDNNEICYSCSNYVVNNSLNCEPFIPEHSEESSVISVVLGFLKKFILLIEQGKEELTVEYTDLLTRLSRSYPQSLSIYFDLISSALQKAGIEKVKSNLIEVLRNIVAANPNVVDQINDNSLSDASDRILSSDIVSNSSIELLSILHQKANGCQLLASCTDFYLANDIDLHGQMLINLLLPPYSLKPPIFNVKNRKPTNVLQSVIALCLIEAWKDSFGQNDESEIDLRIYIKEALQFGPPPDLCALSKPLLAAMKEISE